MASAEWIALGGFLAAVVAFFVSLRAYQLQRRTQSASGLLDQRPTEAPRGPSHQTCCVCDLHSLSSAKFGQGR
jgi:putative exporter of polyketide antibiotics